MPMRKDAEILDDLDGAEQLPPAEREARVRRLFMEVFLDVRELLDSIDSRLCSIDTHAEVTARASAE